MTSADDPVLQEGPVKPMEITESLEQEKVVVPPSTAETSIAAAAPETVAVELEDTVVNGVADSNADAAIKEAPLSNSTAKKTTKKAKSATAKKSSGKSSKTKANTVHKKSTVSKATKKTAGKEAAKGSATAKKGASKAAQCNKKGATKGKNSKSKNKQPEPESELEAVAGPDLFSKHYREFERALARLEKVDIYGYFWDPAPAEFEEKYPSANDDPESANAANDETENAVDKIETTKTEESSSKEKVAETGIEAKTELSEAERAGNDSTDLANNDTADASTKTSSQEPASIYPSHPPFNFEMIRRRRDQGRYIFDISKQEEERIKDITSYANCANPKPVCVIHPKTVNWALFRDDVIGMCDARVNRNPNDLGDGKTGSLDYAVRKIKAVSSILLCLVYHLCM